MHRIAPPSRPAAALRAVAALLHSVSILSMLLLAAGSPRAAQAAMPGDLVSVTTLQANFDADAIGASPDLSLPGAPAGDYLTLDQTAGTIQVVSAYDGLTQPVEIRQVSTPGTIALNAFAASTPAPPEKVRVQWRSVAKDDEAIILMSFAVMASNGATLASLEYLHQGGLSYNGLGGEGQTLPVMQTGHVAQQFTIDVDFLSRTTSLAINGAPVAGFQSVPFAQSGGDVAQLSCYGAGGHPQTMYVDDLSMVASYRVPDRAPTIAAPTSVTGPENALLTFTVTAADPDGEAIASLTAPTLPAGATFTANPANTSGSFAWTPDFTQAGSYSVTFTAANALSASATTAIAISNSDRAPAVTAPLIVDGEEGGILVFTISASDPDGDALSGLAADLSGLPTGNAATFTPDPGFGAGTFRWPMKRGEAGSYSVLFTASNALSGSAATHINVAYSGTTVTGELVWTPKIGEEGTYSVTFTATNALNETGSATATIVIPPAGTAPPLAAIAPSSDGRGISLAPDRALKGPIVSIVGISASTAGQTTTVSATASDGSGVALAAALNGVKRAASATGAAAGIVTFDADLSGLPVGNDARFTVDDEPVVTAPAAITVDPGTPISFAVSASDPNGDPIFGLGADLSILPAGNSATFTSSAPFTSGTFAWTPRVEDAGTYPIVFTAFNALVGQATTLVTVRPVAPATAFTVGPKKIRLASNKPYGCIAIEPVDSSFALLDIDLTSIKMISSGTGSVSEITATSSKTAVIGDRDNDGIQDIQACFTKDDVRALFSLLHGSNTVPVLVRGRLVTGPLFQAPLTLVIQAGGGALNTVMAPNPMNPAGTLSFVTRTPGPVRVALYDVAGRLVRTLWRRDAVEPGAHEIAFEARRDDGRPLPSGVYFYRIDTRDGGDTGRLTVLK